MSLRALALAALSAALPATAHGWIRSTDGSTGACLYWKPRAVTYKINPARAGTSPSCGPATASNSPAAGAVEAGFAAWTGAQQTCTDLALVRGADSTSTKLGFTQGGSNENLVVFRKGWCSELLAPTEPCMTDPSLRCGDTFNCFENTGSLGGTSIIALTTTTYSPSSGEIVDADMEFVDWSGSGSGSAIGGTRPQGWYFTCSTPASPPNACVNYGQASCDSMDLQNTATHEAGHFVGFAHEQSLPESTMAPTAAVGEVKKRTLEPDDVTGLCTVYPKAAATLTCVTPRKKSSGGCGTGGGLGLLGLLSVVALPRRRRPA